MILFMFPTGTIHLYTSIDLISFVGRCFYASSRNLDATFSRSLDSEDASPLCSFSSPHSAIFRNETKSSQLRYSPGSYHSDPSLRLVSLFP